MSGACLSEIHNSSRTCGCVEWYVGRAGSADRCLCGLLFQFDWCIWPPTQWLNFTYVPERYRVLYVNVVTVVWDVFLSYSKHRVTIYLLTHSPHL